ncbi:very-long-chain enoyl-CoA reductase-like [Branchiostoma lanceolatum]|uniref:very-long-chain enoyl-CoA reductase-like n=1 Tax=Branchiostoma lanceolatum TaxID=7740 RepID=UPI003452632B
MASENKILVSPPHISAGISQVLVGSVSYFGTIVVFLLAFYLREFPEVPFPVVGSLLASDGGFGEWTSAGYVLMALWCFHFIRRFVEVLFVHDYRSRLDYLEGVGTPVYYWVFSFWVGLSLRSDLGYVNTHLPLFVIGSLVFLVGEIGNGLSHLQLRSLRSSKNNHLLYQTKSQHVVPHGLMFELVSCPHYFFEIISWLGFSLATWALSVIVFLAATVVTLCFYGYQKHKAYRTEFDGAEGRELYPPNRKALIPFVF